MMSLTAVLYLLEIPADNKRFGFFFGFGKPRLSRVIQSQTSRRRGRIWLLIGVAIVGASFLLDDRVGLALDVTQDPALKQFAKWCSKLGEGWVIAVAGIGLSLIFFLCHRPQTAARIFFVALTSELVGLVVVILRLLFGRARPNNHEVPPGFYGLWHDGHWIAGQFKFSSFPSGHAATAVGLVAAAWLLHRGWALALMPYALAVTWSRMALECHHLSDVLASTVLAIALAVWLKPRLQTSVEFHFGNLHRAWRKK
jgi:membrane-associated phospholipid phosphatase